MNSVIVIPARFKSTRFPGKPLVRLLGRPMIIWVAELSAQALNKESVYIATEDCRIAKVVEDYGFRVIMTSGDALTGTDRVAEVAEKVNADIYLNVQGDEPLVAPADIIKVLSKKKNNIDCIVNGYAVLDRNENPLNVNIPKVITTEDDRMVYMSRQPLPATKLDEDRPLNYKKQVCIYAFTKAELMAFRGYGRKSYLEAYEDIEILRFLELGKTTIMVETGGGSVAVDIKEDVKKAEVALMNSQTDRLQKV